MNEPSKPIGPGIRLCCDWCYTEIVDGKRNCNCRLHWAIGLVAILIGGFSFIGAFLYKLVN